MTATSWIKNKEIYSKNNQDYESVSAPAHLNLLIKFIPSFCYLYSMPDNSFYFFELNLYKGILLYLRIGVIFEVVYHGVNSVQILYFFCQGIDRFSGRCLFRYNIMMFRGQLIKLNQNFKIQPRNPLKIESHVPVIACCNVVPITNEMAKITLPPTQPSQAQNIRIKRVASQKTVKMTVKKNLTRCLSNQPLKQGQYMEPTKKGGFLQSEKKQQALFQTKKTTFQEFKQVSPAETSHEINDDARHEGQTMPLFQSCSRDASLGRKTFPFSRADPTKDSPLFTICKVINETFFFNPKKTLKFDHDASTNDSSRSSTSIFSTEMDERPQERLRLLERKIVEVEQLLERKQKQVKQTEITIIRNREKIQQFDEQFKEYLTITQEVFRRRKIMEEYLSTQQDETLRMEAVQYKKSERKLLVLAKNMQLHNYDSLSTALRQTLQTLQQYLFQNIKDISSLEGKDAPILADRIKSSYLTIMDKVKSLVRQRCGKIQQFQQCLTQLSGRTVGKQQYLNQVNNRMINISAHFSNLCQSLPALPPCAQLPLLEQIRQIADKMGEIYNSAQIYY